MPTTEDQTGDDTQLHNFPDRHTDYSADFAFVNIPTIGASVSLQGIDGAASGDCGQFNAIYQSCIQNTGDEPLENIQAMF